MGEWPQIKTAEQAAAYFEQKWLETHAELVRETTNLATARVNLEIAESRIAALEDALRNLLPWCNSRLAHLSRRQPDAHATLLAALERAHEVLGE